jgi:predicted Zn-dependent protease with MMP-like domain
MEKEKFEAMVEKAVNNLPPEFLTHLNNIEIIVEDVPTADQLIKMKLSSHEVMLGLYEGVPQTRRGTQYGNVLPDKITIFQTAMEATYPDENSLITGIEHVVRHEIAHHFGISDDRLREIGRY